MEITYGRLLGASGFRVEGDVTAVMDRRRSRDVVGVRILRREDSMAVRMVVSIPVVYELQCRMDVGVEVRRTFEAACLDAYQFTLHAFT